MKSLKNREGTSCDRRIDRRKVAIAAAAVLFVFATTARAGVVDFVMDPSVSSLSYAGSTVDLSNVGGPNNAPYTASNDFSGRGSNGLLSYFSGHLYVDLQPTSIQPLATGAGYQLAIGSATSGSAPSYRPSRDGAFIPYDDGYGHPSGSFANPAFGGAPADWGEYGITVSAAGAFARVWDLSIGPTPAYANGVMPLVATNTYAVAPQIWGQLGGYQDLVSGLGNAHTTLGTGFGGGPFPIPLSGTFDASSGSPTYTPGNGVATWDGTTLTINVDGILKYNISSSPKITDTRHLAGVLVYHAVVPEPSSLLLAGCGVVGLLGLAWRSRKRSPEGGTYVL